MPVITCNGFISYAHDDQAVCKALLPHLRALEQKYGLTLWHDTNLQAGQHWNDEIEGAINRADVFILLASPQFIASDYIFGTEIPAIKRRLRRCRGKAVPVLVRDCAWDFPLGALQVVPMRDNRPLPLEDWRPRNKGYDAARAQIDSAVAEHFGWQPRRSAWPRT